MKKCSSFVVGFLIGAMFFGGVVEAASGILAERSTNRIFVDGTEVQLESFLIDGNNYVKLRDVGQAVGYNVYWDGNAVRIESDSPYTGEAPAAKSDENRNVDFSAAANPAVFTGIYTREAYNAAFAVLEGLKNGDSSHKGTVHIACQEDRWKLQNMLHNLWNGTIIELKGTGNGVFEVYSNEVGLRDMNDVMEDYFRQWNALVTDHEKVSAANEFICGQMIYQLGKTASALKIVSAKEPVYANCISYARAMNYLCGQLNIPCLTVPGDNHIWNMMYCDGRWLYTDVSANDLSEDHTWMLLVEYAPITILDPEGIEFLKELLVPGSTI